MLIWAMRGLGLDPAFFVGGELSGVGPDGEAANSGWGSGEWAVVEADESDGSFLVLDPEIAVITNIEMDHHSRWSGLAELREAFSQFAAKASQVVKGVGTGSSPGPTISSVSGSKGNLPNVHTFDLDHPGPVRLSLSVPGEHNVLDARAALAALEAAGIDADDAAGELESFPGVKRRLEFKGECDGARVFDDYAHHPTEVAASLTAVKELEPERLIAVFQPHLYSRTKAFSLGFGHALAIADEIFVLDVYPAREQPVGPLEGVSGLDVLRAAADRAGGAGVWWTPDLGSAERAVRSRLGPGTIVVTIGAGDITKLSDRLVEGDGG
jgi:UDP-N-acetylmuramate--alanine ligase